MGNNNSGRYRKQGREAFMPHTSNPAFYFDYPKDSWSYKFHLDAFLEGWKEAEDNYIEPEMVVIDLEEEAWKQIKQAAKESSWIPKEYYMNDWLADVCNFLRNGGTLNE